MSDHESDTDNRQLKSLKPKKTKYVDAKDVKSKAQKKTVERPPSDDEMEEQESAPSPPPRAQSKKKSSSSSSRDAAPKAVSESDAEDDAADEEHKASLIDEMFGDDDEADMVAALEKQEKKQIKKEAKKSKKEASPQKKQRTDVKSQLPLPEDSDEEQTVKEENPPSYNAFPKSNKAVHESYAKTTKKRKHGESDEEEDEPAAAESDGDEAQQENDSGTESDSSAPAAAASASAKKFPFETNPVDPSYTIRKWSQKNGLHVHFSEQVPKDNWSVLPAANAGYQKSFFSIKCNKEQKFDFGGGDNWKKHKYGNETIIIGPFAATNHPRMWPYGDRFPLPHSKFAPPASSSKIKLKLPLFNTGFANTLNQEKKGVGIVDPTADHFLQNWCRLHFDQWAREQSWKWSEKMFPQRRKTLLDAIVADHAAKDAAYRNSVEEWRTYESAVKEYPQLLKEYERAMKKKKDPDVEKPEKPEKPVKPEPKVKKPDTSEAKKDAELRAAFMKEGVKASVLLGTKDKFEHVNFQSPLLRVLTKAEREGKPEKNIKPMVPNLPNDKFFIDEFKSPEFWVDKSTNPPTNKPGFPKIRVDVPMWRCVTAEEAIANAKRGYKNSSPLRLIPAEHRFIVSGDVVAPVFQIDSFDSKPQSGFRFLLLGVIWLGESGKLRDEQRPVPGLDETTYFCAAAPYPRRKGAFDPQTVENSKYESARTNDEQMAYDPAGDDLYGGYD